MNLCNFLLEKIDNGYIIFNLSNNELNILNNQLNLHLQNSNKNNNFLNNILRKYLKKILQNKLQKINNIMKQTKNGLIKEALQQNNFDTLLHPKIIKKITEINNIFGDLNEHNGIINILYDLIEQNK